MKTYIKHIKTYIQLIKTYNKLYKTYKTTTVLLCFATLCYVLLCFCHVLFRSSGYVYLKGLLYPIKELARFHASFRLGKESWPLRHLAPG